MNHIVKKVAHRVITSSYFSIGDIVLYGKYKNHKGKVISFGSDKWGNPTVTISPIPLGRKKPKTFGLFRIWKEEVKGQKLKEMQEAEAPSASDSAM